MLYYTQSFSSGMTVCYDGAGEIIMYNNDALVPLDPSYNGGGMLLCQSDSIGLYCAFDCAAGLGGVGIECR